MSGKKPLGLKDVVAFGKHKGTAIKDLPSDYANWLLKQDELDPYLRTALEKSGF